MEDTLRGTITGFVFAIDYPVLILVLMEDTLREKKVRVEDPKNRLNPCFNGRYSQRKRESIYQSAIFEVLILVLMEDTLRALALDVMNKRFIFAS